MTGIVIALIFVIGAISAAFGVWKLLPAKQQEQLKNFVINWTIAGIHGATMLLGEGETYLQPIATAFLDAFNKYGGPIATELRAPIAGFVKEEFDVATAGLVANGESTPDNAIGIASTAMADAFGFGGASAAVTAAFEALFPEKLNVLNGVGPMLANMAGFEQVAGAVRDPLYEAAFGTSLKYHFRSLFKPELPDEADAVTWHSRGLLTDDQLKVIFDYSGLKTEYEEAFVESAYRPVSAFIMLRLMQSGVIDDAALDDALTFNGYREKDKAALIKYAKWAALTTYRGQYMSSVLTAAERGVLSDTDVDDALDSMEAPAGAKPLVHLAIATRKLEQLAEIYRKSVSEAYKYGLITDADYVPNLEAIGIAAADAEAHYAVDSIAKQGKALLAEQRAEARAAAKLKSAAVLAALAEFRTGTIDTAALEAALLAAGLDPGLAGFAVAIAVARQRGTQVMVYGLLKDRAGAIALREKVAAVGEQTKKKLITTDQAIAALKSEGIPDEIGFALVAEWAAVGYKTVLPV